MTQQHSRNQLHTKKTCKKQTTLEQLAWRYAWAGRMRAGP